jgi:hypothetical protein
MSPGLGDRLGRGLGDGVGGVIVDGRAVVGIVQQGVQFVLGDPDQPEVEVLGHQPAQFLEQQRLVPSAQFGQLVVGDAVGPALRLGQMVQHDDRRLGQPQLRGGQDAAMARDQLAVGGDEAGDGPAELGHAGGDPRHLVGVVGLGIAGIGAEAGQRPERDLARAQMHRHAASRLAFRAAKVSPVSASTASWPVKDCQRSMATST